LWLIVVECPLPGPVEESVLFLEPHHLHSSNQGCAVMYSFLSAVQRELATRNYSGEDRIILEKSPFYRHFFRLWYFGNTLTLEGSNIDKDN
jgi:hypothetical protein